MKRMRYWLLLVSILVVTLTLFTDQSYAESYVEDETGKITKETKDYITQLNRENYSVLSGNPEFGIAITRDVEPKGNKLDLHVENEFRNFDFKMSDNDVNSLVVFVLAQDEIRFAYGEKLTSVFEPLTKDDQLKKRLLEQLRADKYNEAVIEVSDYVYQHVEKAYSEKGLATLSNESDQIRENNRKKKQYKIIRFAMIGVGIIILGGVGCTSYLRYKKNGVKRQFYTHIELPNKLTKDGVFNQKDFDHWLENNSKVYNNYHSKNEAVRALKYYCLNNFFPKKINQLKTITDQQNMTMKQSLNNRKIGDYLFTNYFSDELFTVLMFNTMILDAHSVSKAYTENLLSHLSKQIGELAITDGILESKWPLLSEYKLSLYEEAKASIIKKYEQSDFLVKNMIANQSYEQLLETLSDELEKVILSCFKPAIFKVDLEQVYALEPIYKEIMENDFSDDDLSEAMFSIRVGYKTDQTSILKLKEIVKAVIINTQETIRDRKKQQVTVVRFDFVEREVKTVFRPKSKNRFFD